MADHCCPPRRSFQHWIPSFQHRAMYEEQQPAMATTPLFIATEDTPSHPALLCLGRILSTVLPIAGVVLGTVYLDQCPRQPLIPIALIVHNVGVLLLILLRSLPCGDNAEWQRALVRYLQFACLLFLIAWFIASSVWIYSIYPPNYEAVGHQSYCRRDLYLFAFGTTTAVHVILGVALLFSLCIMAVFFFFGVVLPFGGHGDLEGP